MRIFPLFSCLTIAIAGLALLSACGTQQETADLILTNGNVITMDAANPKAQGVAIKGDRILTIGDDAAVLAHKGAETETIDLQGATAIPGFIEGHGHLKSIGIAKMNLGLMDVANWDEVIAMVSQAAKDAEPGEWILGRGWHQEKWNTTPENHINGYPTHHGLSEVSPNNPVLLQHASGHAAFANAKAMEIAGITDKTPDPMGGKIIRDGDGKAIGVLEETALSQVAGVYQKTMAERTTEERDAYNRKAMDLAMAECLTKGITSFQDAGSSFEDIDLYKALADEGKLTIRLMVMAGSSNEELKKRLPDYELKGYANNFLTLGGIKRYADGALGSRGAWLLEPYSDLASSSGQNVTSLEDLREAGEIALASGLQLCTHAIGDRGNREMLDIYESVLAGKDLRWRIEHAQHLSPDDIPRFASLNVIASMQGVHCTSDAPFVVKRLGEKRAEEGAYVWRALLENGAVVSNGTDAPVEDVDPLPNFYSTVTRTLKNGDSFYPAQKLAPLEALRTFTLNAAYAAFEEHIKGSLEAGKMADITVLSKDITAIDPEEIHTTEVRYTIVGGKVAYARASDD